MNFKLSFKQLLMLLFIAFGLALVLSMLATWLDPKDFFQQPEIQWPLVWVTLQSWLWALWIIFAALGYVFMMIYRIVNG